MSIRIVIYGSVFINSITSRRFNRIDICADKKEFPTVFFFLSLNHLFNLLTAVTMTCVFLTVGRNNKHRMLRYIFGTGILMDVTNVMNRTSNSINKRRATTNGVIFVCHFRNIGKFHSIVQDFTFIIKENSRNIATAVLFLLLFNH